jgi:hypothetical protein
VEKGEERLSSLPDFFKVSDTSGLKTYAEVDFI